MRSLARVQVCSEDGANGMERYEERKRSGQGSKVF
jgi:hypothetical protein